MLKRGWMLRYMPPIVAETIPEYVTIAGYAWAALMFALGLGTIAVASTGDLKLWAIYVSVVAVGREDRGLRRAICRVSHPHHQPASRRPRRVRMMRLYRFAPGIRVKTIHHWAWAARCAIPPPEATQDPRTIPVLRTNVKET